MEKKLFTEEKAVREGLCTDMRTSRDVCTHDYNGIVGVENLLEVSG